MAQRANKMLGALKTAPTRFSIRVGKKDRLSASKRSRRT
jgi:hypothetical protein